MAKINLKNIKSYIQGTIRIFLYTYFPCLIRKHIKEQFEFRLKSAEACYKNGSCLSCGCKTPDLFMADKGCSLGELPEEIRVKLTGKTEACYPAIMDRKEWNKYCKTLKN